jgi:hypothetical protein
MTVRVDTIPILLDCKPKSAGIDRRCCIERRSDQWVPAGALIRVAVFPEVVSVLHYSACFPLRDQVICPQLTGDLVLLSTCQAPALQ